MSDLIDRQAAIDRIEEHLRFGDELYPLTETDKILNHAFEIATSCVYNLPPAQPEPRWIPVSEKPRKNGEYLVTKIDHITNDRLVDIASYGNFIPYNNGFYKADNVIAWMPLPEPFREETEDE